MSLFSRAKELVQSGFVRVAGEDNYERVRSKFSSMERYAKETYQSLKSNAKEKIHDFKSLTISDVTYITPSIIIMSFPFNPYGHVATKVGIDRHKMLLDFLETNHRDHYLIINISDEHYDPKFFNNNVTEFFFPGYSCPPFGVIIELCKVIDSWLHSDNDNIVLIHCRNGKGRSIVTASCYLSYSGQIPNTIAAAQYICEKKKINYDTVLIPTQKRYLEYFKQYSKQVMPHQNALHLVEIRLNDDILIPSMENKAYNPYFQILCGESVFIVEADEKDRRSFLINANLIGDVLFRYRVDVDDKLSHSIFRFGLNFGYINQTKLVLNINELDGPQSDKTILFPESFEIELFFDQTNSALPIPANSYPLTSSDNQQKHDQEKESAFALDEEFEPETVQEKKQIDYTKEMDNLINDDLKAEQEQPHIDSTDIDTINLNNIDTFLESVLQDIPLPSTDSNMPLDISEDSFDVTFSKSESTSSGPPPSQEK